MGIQEVHRQEFASFLYSLRSNLTLQQGYSEVLLYANELAGLDAMSDFADKIFSSLDPRERIEAFLKYEEGSRGLSGAHKESLSAYLRYLRDQQLNILRTSNIRPWRIYRKRSLLACRDNFSPIIERKRRGQFARPGGAETE